MTGPASLHTRVDTNQAGLGIMRQARARAVATMSPEEVATADKPATLSKPTRPTSNDR
ncbi:MAG: hypothetical protein NVSMB32_04630 [Actinomycetota bacterium]